MIEKEDSAAIQEALRGLVRSLAELKSDLSGSIAKVDSLLRSDIDRVESSYRDFEREMRPVTVKVQILERELNRLVSIEGRMGELEKRTDIATVEKSTEKATVGAIWAKAIGIATLLASAGGAIMWLLQKLIGNGQNGTK